MAWTHCDQICVRAVGKAQIDSPNKRWSADRGRVPFSPSVNLLHHPPWVWSLDWSGFLSDSVNKTSISAGRSYSFGLTAEHQQRVKWTSNLGEQIVPGLGPVVLVALLSWSICRTGDGTHAFSRLGWSRGVEENSCKHKQPLHSTPLV